MILCDYVVCMCQYAHTCCASMCCVCARTPPSFCFSFLLCLCASVQGGARSEDRFQQALRRELPPLSPTFALYFTSCYGSRVAGSPCSSSTFPSGCLTLGYSRDMCERSSYFYPALTGCDGSVEEGLSAFQGC